MIERILEAKNIFQDFGGLLEIIITLTTTAISIVLWMQKKQKESRIRALAIPPAIGDKNDQVGLIIELTNGEPEGIYQAILGSVNQQKGMSKLNKILVKAKALSGSHSMEKLELEGGFIVDYYYTADGDIPKGRFVSLTNKERMPKDATDYLVNFNKAINSLLSMFRKNGVHTIHVFFHGPVPLNAYVGAKFIIPFTVFFYHFEGGKYYLLGNSNIVKDNMSQAK